MSEKDGGPAFPAQPTQFFEGAVSITAHNGMTLRDWFASHATDEDIYDQMSLIPKVETVFESTDGRRQIIYATPKNSRQIARYMHADAMLFERAK